MNWINGGFGGRSRGPWQHEAAGKNRVGGEGKDAR